MLCIFTVANVGLQEHHHFIAMVALSQLDELCKKIYNKSITLGSLDIVKQKCGQLKKLCDAVNFGSKDHCMPFSQVKPQLDLCIELQIKFLNYRDHISTLLGLCGGISEGMLYNYVIDTCTLQINIVFLNYVPLGCRLSTLHCMKKIIRIF